MWSRLKTSTSPSPQPDALTANMPEPCKKENNDITITITEYSQTLSMADSLLQNQLQRLWRHAGHQKSYHQTHLEGQRSHLYKTVPVVV